MFHGFAIRIFGVRCSKHNFAFFNFVFVVPIPILSKNCWDWVVGIWWKRRKNYCRFVYIFRVGYVRRIVGVILAHVLKLVDRTTWSISVNWPQSMSIDCIEQRNLCCWNKVVQQTAHWTLRVNGPISNHMIDHTLLLWLVFGDWKVTVSDKKNLETIIFEVIAVFFWGAGTHTFRGF